MNTLHAWLRVDRLLYSIEKKPSGEDHGMTRFLQSSCRSVKHVRSAAYAKSRNKNVNLKYAKPTPELSFHHRNYWREKRPTKN